MNAVGMNTAARMTAIATTGPDTSPMAFSVASRGDMPSSMWCSTASTTTIASSTTRPMASTRPKRESVFTENPKAGKRMKVPMSDTGTARSGISVGRQPCRNTNTTRMTSSSACQSVFEISRIPSDTACVVSRPIAYSRPCGKLLLILSIAFLTPLAQSRALEPGSW